jgi:hypothetical protein
LYPTVQLENEQHRGDGSGCLAGPDHEFVEVGGFEAERI